MNLKDYICESGRKIENDGHIINEDRVKFINIANNNECYKFSILMDGASGLGKNNNIVKDKTSAEWFVDFILEQLEKEILESKLYDIKELLRKCIVLAKDRINEFEIQNNIKLKDYEIPSASFSILKDNGKTFEIFLLGDTVTLIKYKNSNKVEIVKNPNQEAVQNNDNIVLKKAKEISIKQSTSVRLAIQEKEIVKMLQNNRSKKNCDCNGGYYILSTDFKALNHGVTINLDNKDIEGILLLTDGIDYKILGLDENMVYNYIKNNGFEALLKQIRVRQLEDFDYNEYPRFKMSDDASGIFIENLIQKKLIKK